jgi:hypothetical protein
MHPAVNLQNLPGYVAGAGRNQERHRRGDILGRAQTAQRDEREELLLRLLAQLVGHG